METFLFRAENRMTYTPTLFYRFTVFITAAQQEDAFVKIFINRN